MKIYRPIVPKQVSQAFGDSSACVAIDINRNVIRPMIVTPKNGSCQVGSIDLYQSMGMKGHNGWDMSCWSGCPVYFPVEIPGVEWYALNASDNDGGLGVDVVSRTEVTVDGRTGYLKFRFWHFKASAVAEYAPVKLGQLIGLANNTGASSGSHLHWSMKWCDKDGNGLDKNNGYYGATDFKPWYVDTFVGDTIPGNCVVPQQEIKTLVNKIFFLVGEFLVKLIDVTKTK